MMAETSRPVLIDPAILSDDLAQLPGGSILEALPTKLGITAGPDGFARMVRLFSLHSACDEALRCAGLLSAAPAAAAPSDSGTDTGDDACVSDDEDDTFMSATEPSDRTEGELIATSAASEDSGLVPAFESEASALASAAGMDIGADAPAAAHIPAFHGQDTHTAEAVKGAMEAIELLMSQMDRLTGDAACDANRAGDQGPVFGTKGASKGAPEATVEQPTLTLDGQLPEFSSATTAMPKPSTPIH